jgi:hypothetical protein
VADLNARWTAIASATVDLPARLQDWKNWGEYCPKQGYNDPYLEACAPIVRSTLLVGFAACYRTGGLGCGIQVQGDTVTAAIQHIGHMFEMAGRKPTGSKDLLLAFSRQLKSYQNKDPSSESQVPLPVQLFSNICDNEGASVVPVEQATADIITIMFYFLVLRVGKITCPKSNRARQTDNSASVTPPSGEKRRMDHKFVSWQIRCLPSCWRQTK